MCRHPGVVKVPCVRGVHLRYLSIAYAFTLFDHRQKGLHDLPGLCEHWLSPLSLVFLFRVCEVKVRCA
eukprot:1904734-Amphidinium_carterae.1